MLNDLANQYSENVDKAAHQGRIQAIKASDEE